MKPWEALQTATLLPAKAFGDMGSIEPRKLADIVMVEGDPLRGIKDAAKLQTVIVDGRVYSIPDLLATYVKEAISSSSQLVGETFHVEEKSDLY